MDLRNRLASQVQDMKPENFTRIDSTNQQLPPPMNQQTQLNQLPPPINQQSSSINQLPSSMNQSTPIQRGNQYKTDTISIADSDIGSALDLDLNDFENSIN